MGEEAAQFSALAYLIEKGNEGEKWKPSFLEVFLRIPSHQQNRFVAGMSKFTPKEREALLQPVGLRHSEIYKI